MAQQVQTERGLVCVSHILGQKEFIQNRASYDQYTYAFYSAMLNSDFYSISLDASGLYHDFIQVKRDV